MAHSTNIRSESIMILLPVVIIVCLIFSFFFYNAMAASAAANSAMTAFSSSQSLQRTKPAMRFLDISENSATEASLFRMKARQDSNGRINNVRSLFLILLVFLLALSNLLFLQKICRIVGVRSGCLSILSLQVGGKSPPVVHA